MGRRKPGARRRLPEEMGKLRAELVEHLKNGKTRKEIVDHYTDKGDGMPSNALLAEARKIANGAPLKGMGRAERRAQVLKLVKQGLTYPEISARFVSQGEPAPSTNTIADARKQLGLGDGRLKLQPKRAERRAQVFKLVKRGMTHAEISARFVSQGEPAPSTNTIADARKQLGLGDGRLKLQPKPEPGPKPTANEPHAVTIAQDTSVSGLLRQLLLSMQAEGVESISVQDDGSFTMTKGGKL